MKSILSFLNDCELGKKQICRNLTLFPVLYPEAIEPYYLTLEQAIESGLLTVTEVDDAGNVNRFEADQRGIETDPPHRRRGTAGGQAESDCQRIFSDCRKDDHDHSVSCVEERRWQYDSPKFSAGKKVMHASLRREAQSSMCHSLSSGSGHRSDQSRISNGRRSVQGLQLL